MSCVAEVAQRKKGMQGSGRGDGHKSHGERGGEYARFIYFGQQGECVRGPPR